LLASAEASCLCSLDLSFTASTPAEALWDMGVSQRYRVNGQEGSAHRVPRGALESLAVSLFASLEAAWAPP